MINLCFFMFFMSNSSFYMFLLTYMYQKLKNIKNIYIFKKSLPDSLPNRELLKMVAPAPASAPAPRSHSRSQVTLDKTIISKMEMIAPLMLYVVHRNCIVGWK